MDVLEDAKQFIDKEFIECHFALVVGSVVRGEGTQTSDLDIVIITNVVNAYRESSFEFGWPIEIFVHNNQTIIEFFKSDIQRRRPSIVKMVSEGVIIKDEANLGSSLKDIANEMLTIGPKPFNKEEAELERYFITDLLDDLIGSERHEEQIFIINELSERLCNFILVNRKEWKGRGKWIPRLIKKLDEDLYSDLMRAIDEFSTLRKVNLLIEFTERELGRYGGRCFEGYSMGKS